MTKNALSCSSLLAVILALGACSSSGSSATQLVVTVDSDLKVPSEIDRVTIDVADHATAPEASADLTKQGLPRTIGLVHDQGPLGPFTVKALGFLGSKRVIERRVITSFVEGKTVDIAIDLDRACMAVFCDAGQTCIAGTCQDIPSNNGGDDGGASSGAGTGASGAEAGATNGIEAGATSGGDGGGTTGGTTAGTTGSPDGGPGDPPVCTIDVPEVNDAYEQSKPFAVSGSCSDPESGNLTVNLAWTSDLDGKVGNGANTPVTLTTKGTHELKLCAPDPVDTSVVSCDTVSIEISTDVQPHVIIDKVEQNNSTALPFRTNKSINYLGSGTGAGVTLSWTDSIHGALGMGPSATLSQPELGKHLVTLVGTDRNQAKGEAEYPYTVLESGHSSLIDVYTTANTGLGGNGGNADVSSLGVDPAARVYAAANSKLFEFVGDQANPNATVAVDAPPLVGAVLDIFVDAADGLAYLGTTAGLTVCNYVSLTGIASVCNTYKGNDFPSNNVTSVVRLKSDGDPYTIIGTSNGPLVLDSASGTNQGNQPNNFDAQINAMAVSGEAMWAATDDGLYRYNPSSDKSTHTGTDQGALTNNMTSLAVSTDGGTVWVGSSSGLLRYKVGFPGQWSAFDTGDGLASNTIKAVTVARTTIGGVARDVIWIATASGVSRFDPTIPSFTTFTTADGLPSNTVHDIVVLSNGTKVFATAAGVARYTGP